jgi:hypothetical protein
MKCKSFRFHARRDGDEISSALKKKVAFITARFRTNCPWLWGMVRECHVSCLSHPAVIRGVVGTKDYCGLKGKVPFHTPQF